MSRRATCPICSKLFFHGCNYNNTRANLTCGPVCAAVQKVKRQKERRAEKRLARLHTQGLKKVIRTHGKVLVVREHTLTGKHTHILAVQDKAKLTKAARARWNRIKARAKERIRGKGNR